MKIFSEYHRSFRFPSIILAFVLNVLCGFSAFASDVERPGNVSKGVVLLPNGWRLASAGKHLPLDDLPMNMLESPDGNYLIVTNNGYSKPVLDVIDLKHFY